MARDSRGRFVGGGGGGSGFGSAATVDASAFLQDFHALEADLHRAVEEAVRVAVDATEESAQKTTRYQDRTTNLRKSTKRGMVFATNGEVSAGDEEAFYALFVENSRGFMYEAEKVGEKVLDHGLEYYCDQAINKAG